MKNTFFALFLLLLPLRVWGVSTGVHTWAEQSALNKGNWVKISLDDTEDGIYQITYKQLRNWGFSDPSQVGVYGFGGHTLNESFSINHIDDLPEVAVYHDSSHQRILFFGRGMTSWKYQDATFRWVQRQHPYATVSYYFLHQKSDGTPRTLDLQQSSAVTPSVTVSEYDERWLHESETANIGETGRQWFGESFISSTVQNFSLPEQSRLKGHVLKAGTALLTVNFGTTADAATTYSVRIGDTKIGDKTVPATTGSYVKGSVGQFNKELSEVQDLNGAQVRITYSTNGGTVSFARLDYIRLQGKCDLEASTSEAFLLFRNAEAEKQHIAYRIKGIKSQMQVWDVTSPVDIFQQQLDGDSLFVPEQTGIREYAIVNLQSDNFSGVTRVSNVKNQDLHSLDSINLVILTAPAYITQANQLAEYRLNNDGISSVVVTPDIIYNEYSSGVPDITAIRLFLKNLYEKSLNYDVTNRLRYLILFGDGHYNNRTVCKSSYLLPSYESEQSLSETASYVCDDYFGFLDDNEGGKIESNMYTLAYDGLDIGIGRLPVSNTTEADEVIAKIMGYDSNQYGNWRNHIVFLSDDDKNDSSGTDSENLHMRHNDQLVSILQSAGHYEYMVQKIYLPAYKRTLVSSGSDYPDARKELNNALQEGTLILNYAGHGSTNNITHEQIMSTNLASQLRMKHLPVWITASCDVSRWDGDNTSMGETLFLNPNGGASALISTTRIVYASQNLSLNKAIFRHLFDRLEDGSRYRLGDILRSAKVDLSSDRNKLNYCLIGDPTMRLAFPEQKMVIDSIQGEFSALNEVTIHGHVLKSDGVEVDETFHGLIYPTVFDAEETITADKGLWQSTSSSEEIPYTFKSRTSKIFSGRGYITNGRFSFSFRIPKDISSNTGNGLINLYACSEDGREGNGYYMDFALQKDEAANLNDSVGPTIIACFMDDPDFKSGDKVSRTPYLYAEVSDPSGINATGSSIGHDVSITIQNLSNPMASIKQFNLNNYFTTFTGDHTHGNVKYHFSELDEGTYRATFRVWDNCNNPTSYTFDFEVSSKTKPEITLMQAYPSPVKQGENVTFRLLHNRPESAETLRLQVYTQTGVKVLDKTINSSSCEVVYLEQGATRPTQISKALNADETSQLMGSTTLTWTADIVPGVYLYRAYLTVGGDETATKSKLLIVY